MLSDFFKTLSCLLQKKDNDVALVGAFRRVKEKEIALEALAAENKAAMQLVRAKWMSYVLVQLVCCLVEALLTFLSILGVEKEKKISKDLSIIDWTLIWNHRINFVCVS